MVIITFQLSNLVTIFFKYEKPISWSLAPIFFPKESGLEIFCILVLMFMSSLVEVESAFSGGVLVVDQNILTGPDGDRSFNMFKMSQIAMEFETVLDHSRLTWIVCKNKLVDYLLIDGSSNGKLQ